MWLLHLIINWNCGKNFRSFHKSSRTTTNSGHIPWSPCVLDSYYFFWMCQVSFEDVVSIMCYNYFPCSLRNILSWLIALPDSPSIWSHLDASSLGKKFVLSCHLVFDVLFFVVLVLVWFGSWRSQRYEFLCDVSIEPDTVMNLSNRDFWRYRSISCRITLQLVRPHSQTNQRRNAGGVVYNLWWLSSASQTVGDFFRKLLIES